VHRPTLARTLCRCLAVLSLALLSPAARADEQPLSYRLLARDRAVGSREVTLQYVTTDTGELRLLQAFTTFVLPIPKGTLSYEQRMGTRLGGDRSFVASMATNGEVREVQARQALDNTWAITAASAAGAHSRDLPGDAIDLTSAELLDPERALHTLGSLGTLRLLSAETGAILEGPVTALGPATLPVGPDEVEVQRFRFEPAEGPMTFAYSADGWLVAYDYQVMGLLVGARLDKLPPPRSFDTELQAPLIGGNISEEQL
jgi:hypothetical protein